MAADIADLVRGPVAIDRWMDDGMIDEGHALLAKFVPAPGVVLVRIVKVRVGAEGREKRRLVIRRTAHPAVGHAGPFGNGVAAGDEILNGLWRLEEGVRHSRVARVCGHQQLVLSLVVMQRVEQARHHPGGVAEGRMGGDVLDALAVDEDLAAVAQGFDVLRAGLRFGDFHLADVFALFALAALAVDASVVVAFAIMPSRNSIALFLMSVRLVRYSNRCAESE